MVTATAVGCGPYPLVLFLLGHICSPLGQLPRSKPRAGLFCILFGILIPAFHYIPGQYIAVDILGRFAIVSPHSFFNLQAEIAASLVFFGVILSPCTRQFLAWKPILWLGRQSFGIYLLHIPILFSVGMAAWLRGGVWLAVPSTIVVTSIFAVLFERWVDRPAIAWSHAFQRAWRTAPVA